MNLCSPPSPKEIKLTWFQATSPLTDSTRSILPLGWPPEADSFCKVGPPFSSCPEGPFTKPLLWFSGEEIARDERKPRMCVACVGFHICAEWEPYQEKVFGWTEYHTCRNRKRERSSRICLRPEVRLVLPWPQLDRVSALHSNHFLLVCSSSWNARSIKLNTVARLETKHSTVPYSVCLWHVYESVNRKLESTISLATA